MTMERSVGVMMTMMMMMLLVIEGSCE